MAQKRPHTSKSHPGKNLGAFLHPPKAKAPNPLAVPTKPHAAPRHQTKIATPRAPVNMLKARMKIGK